MRPQEKQESQSTQNAFVLQQGLLFRTGDVLFELCQETDDGWHLRNIQTQEKLQTTNSDLLSAIARSDVELAIPATDDANEDEIRIRELLQQDRSRKAAEAAMHKSLILKKLDGMGYGKFTPRTLGIRLAIESACKELNVPTLCPDSLYRARKKLDRADGSLAVIAPRYEDRGGKYGSRIPTTLQQKIETVLQSLKEDKQAKVTAGVVRREVETALRCAGDPNELLLQLSDSTLSRRINAKFSKYELCVRNYGKERADREFKNTHPRDRAEIPLEVGEIDDTDADVFLVDHRTMLPFGRAWLTPCIDQYSQLPLGTELSHEHRSRFSQLSAIVDAMLPFDLSLPEFEGVGKEAAEIFGKFGIIVMDNPPQNHSEDILSAAREYPFIAAWAKPYTPTEKSDVEGFHAIFKRDFCKFLAGYRGSEFEGLSLGTKNAVLTVSQFKRLANQWIYNVYAHDYKIASGHTPYQLFQEGIRDRWLSRQIPTDIRRFKLMATLRKTVSIVDGTIWPFKIPYSHPQLVALQKKYGANHKIEVRYNPHNLGKVWMVDFSGQSYLEIESAWPEYAEGLTEHQQELICKFNRDNGVRNPMRPELIDARMKLKQTTEQLYSSKKFRDRKKAMVIGDVGGDDLVPPADPDQPVPATVITTTVRVSELEAIIDGIDDIELDFDEEDC